MGIDLSKTCCFSGHRPEKANMKEQDIKFRLGIEIDKAVKDGYTTFISGMARGVDIWAAELVLEKKRVNKDIKLICAQPYEYFSKDQSWQWNVKYKKIAALADEVVTISYKSNKGCYMLRNKWMVDHSSRLIAVFNGEPSGTKNTIDYAQKKKIQIIVLEVKANESTLSEMR